MEIQTHRLKLTEITWAELENIHQLHSIFEVDEFNTVGIPKNIEETRAGIKLSLDKFRIGEIFYKLLPEHWGKGYATEVSKKMIDIGFDRFDLHRIEAGCAVKNFKSIRVLEKSGMIREGIYRKILPIRGAWVDSYMYSIIEDERNEKKEIGNRRRKQLNT